MDKKSAKSQLRIGMATIVISILAIIIAGINIIVCAVKGEISWIGIIIVVIMAYNTYISYKRRKGLIAYMKENNWV